MRIAIAQIAPRLLDRDATIARVVQAVADAAADQARLVAFGEVLIPGYPIWLSRAGGARFDDPAQKALHARYLEQAVTIEDGHLDPVRNAAREHRIAIVLGVAERPRDRAGHTLFCSRVIIDETGDILSVHRKLMPTYEERLCWSIGDGAGLVTHPIGDFTVGALNCWENWMPLARAALYAAGENLHVMLWPGCVRNTQDLTRVVARESRSYVISASALLNESDVPADLPLRDQICPTPGEVIHDGGSALAGPDGEWIIEPRAMQPGIICADLDLQRVLEERQNFDPSGHYARPDVLRMIVNRQRLSVISDS